jgi:uncharacterized protein YcaQ
VVSAAGGLQAQDVPAAILGVRARATGNAGPTAADVENALYTSHTIVHTWCMRSTLHFVSAADLAWMLPLLGPVFSASGARRNAQLGLDAAALRRGVQVIGETLAQRGPLTREDLSRELDAHGVATAGQALIHVIAQAALEGIVLVGAKQGGKLTYGLLEDWIGPLRPLERPSALAELARRYLNAYAPAALEDFAAWSGLKMGEARQGWEAIAGEVVAVQAAGRQAWFPAERQAWLEEALPEGPQVRLLPYFDSYLLGYARRELVMDPQFKPAVFTGGVIQAVVLVDGRAAGTWRMTPRRKALEITAALFEEFSSAVKAALEQETQDIGRFLGEKAVLVFK